MCDQSGKICTEKTVAKSLKFAKDNNIMNIVVATCTGYTASFLKNEHALNRVIVTHVYGFAEKGKNELDESVRNDLINAGCKAHVLSGAERGISKKFGGIYPVEIVANTLRMFGQGVKVAVEISIMALDAGLIPFGEKIISIGGTEEGADSALVITPSYAHSLFDCTIHEILCKPRI